MGERFSLRYTANRIDFGIARQQQIQGTTINWWFFRSDLTQTDDIYDEGSIAGGKRYHGPYRIPVYTISRVEGMVDQAAEGFQTIDHLTLHMSLAQAKQAGLLPATDKTNAHLKDRFTWDGKVWKPSTIITRNLLSNLRRFMIVVMAQEVLRDEMVNDPDFLQDSDPTVRTAYDWTETGL